MTVDETPDTVEKVDLMILLHQQQGKPEKITAADFAYHLSRSIDSFVHYCTNQSHYT